MINPRIALLAYALPACATITSNITPNGNPGYSIACPLNQATCVEKAGMYCPTGYIILAHTEAYLWIECHQKPAEGGCTQTPVKSPGF